MADAPTMATVAQPDDEADIHDAFSKLGGILGSQSHLNYDQIFAPYMDKIKAMPTPRKPGRAEAFSRAFGSDQGNASVLGEIAQHKQGVQDKSDRLMQTERDILEAKVRQEMETGKASSALKTLEQQKILESKLDANKRTRDLDNYQKKQDIIFGKKSALEGEKAGYAKDLVEKKANMIAKTLGFDEKMRLKLLELGGQAVVARLRSRFTFDPMLGPSMSEQEMGAYEADAQDELSRIAQGLMQERHPAPAASADAPPAAAVTPPATAGKPSRLRQIAEGLRQSRTGKK